MNIELVGKLHVNGETKTYGESFTKREFVLFIANERAPEYPDYRKIALTKDKCALLDNCRVGDELKVSINLRGRLWTNPKGEEVCFNEDEAWKIENLSGSTQQPMTTTQVESQPANSDLPF